MSNKAIFYKNKNRAVAEAVEKYIPQYVQLGLEPEDRGSSQIPFVEENAELSKSTIPNIGNHIEWFSGVDSEMVDDLPTNLDPNAPMIDNNFMGDELSSNKKVADIIIPTDVFTILKALNEEYVLLLDNEILYSGTLSQVEEQIQLLVFGEHELCSNQNIAIDSIMVLKKCPIKIGAFIG